MAADEERRRLIERIDQFLRRLESAKRDPSAFESDAVTQALDQLWSMNYRAGQRAVQRAERVDGIPPEEVVVVNTGALTATTAELRERLTMLRGE